MIYVLSVAFQLAAGVLLLLWSIKRINKSVIGSYFAGSNIACRDEDGNVVLERSKLQRKCKVVLLNMCSFLNLTIGYLLSIFGNKQFADWCNLLLVVIITVFVIFAENFICLLIARILYSKDIRKSLQELDELGVHDVDTIVTEKEIDELFSKDYNP